MVIKAANRWFILFSWLFLVSAQVFSAPTNNKQPLTPDKAFQLSVQVVNPKEISVNWKIAPGYFLYVKRVGVQINNNVPADIRYPKPDLTPIAQHGNELLYSADLRIPVIFYQPQKSASITVSYQGCAEDGFCYPPTQRNFVLNLAEQQVMTLAGLADTGSLLQSLLTDQNRIQALLFTEHIGLMLFVFLCLGVLLAFTPCVLPMLPILTGIIVGQKQAVSTRRAFFLSLAYVMGMASMYALGGVLAALLGSSIQVALQKPIYIWMVASLFVLLGLSLFEFYDFPFSRRLQNKVMTWSNRHQGGTYFGVFFMGVLSTLIVSPCITAPMVGVLVYIGQTGDVLLGAGTLFAMGLGMGIPLMLIGTSAGKWLPKSGPWMKVIVKLFGLVMFGVAIWILSRVLPHTVELFLWSFYFLGIAFFMWRVMPVLLKHPLLYHTLSVFFAAIGMIIFYNAAHISMSAYVKSVPMMTSADAEGDFITVRSSESLQSALAHAQALHRPVLLDFYADWCESCISMDKKVFDLPMVKKALKDFVLIRVDLSLNTAEDEAILKKYNVIAPPTILLFNGAGQEITSRRMVGEMPAADFLSRLNLFIAQICHKKAEC